MNDNHPVTHGELRDILKEFKQELKQEFRDELVPEIMAGVRQIETNILTAFHSYAKGNAVRLSAMDVTDRELRLRMDALENRVLALETQRPPAA